MTDPNEEGRSQERGTVRVSCRRTGETFDPEAHGRCPYCFGSKSDIRPGNHKDFCDYDPEKDPVSFGFPSDSARAQHG